jgi:hypothetical protein
MQKITTVEELRESILVLEMKQKEERTRLKEQFDVTFDGLKPLNILKKSIKDIMETPNLTDNIVGTAVGLATGLITKTIVIGASRNPIKKVLGLLMEVGVSNAVSKHPEIIKTAIAGVATFFRSRKKDVPKETENEENQLKSHYQKGNY